MPTMNARTQHDNCTSYSRKASRTVLRTAVLITHHLVDSMKHTMTSCSWSNSSVESTGHMMLTYLQREGGGGYSA